jgi:hypothetical protein
MSTGDGPASVVDSVPSVALPRRSRRRWQNATPPRAAQSVTAARPLAAEREYLHIHRDAIAQKIAELDERIDVMHAAPHAVPLLSQRLQRFDNWRDGETAFRYRASNGQTMTVHIPNEDVTRENEAIIADLAASIECRAVGGDRADD